MALSSTMYRFTLDVSDVDRNVYATEELRVARHPSESESRMLARVLAYTLELAPDLAMGRGLCHADEPAMVRADLTGQVLRWIDVGVPAADRLHRATKRAPEVAIYAYRPIQPLLTEARQRAIHGAERIEVHTFPQAWIDPIAARIERQCALSILRSDGTLYVTLGDDTETTPFPTTRLSDLVDEG